MRYILAFGESHKRPEILGIFDTEQEANAAMVKALADKGIHPYYYRCWNIDEYTECIDYGSHSHFYYKIKTD